MFKKEFSTIVANKKAGKSKLASDISVIAPGKENIQEAITCPADSDVNDFISYSLCQFIEDIEAFVNFIKPECQQQAQCACMNAGAGNSYLWQDSKEQKPYEVSSVIYCQKLMAWGVEQLNNGQLFPVEDGGVYPKDFLKQVKPIFRRLVRVYMHIVHCHMNLVKMSGMEAKFFHCLKLYTSFTLKYKLCEEDDFAPIAHVLKEMK